MVVQSFDSATDSLGQFIADRWFAVDHCGDGGDTNVSESANVADGRSTVDFSFCHIETISSSVYPGILVVQFER